jgi:hypothetical protein
MCCALRSIQNVDEKISMEEAEDVYMGMQTNINMGLVHL